MKQAEQERVIDKRLCTHTHTHTQTDRHTHTHKGLLMCDGGGVVSTGVLGLGGVRWSAFLTALQLSLNKPQNSGTRAKALTRHRWSAATETAAAFKDL